MMNIEKRYQELKRENARPAEPLDNITLKATKLTGNTVTGVVMSGHAAGQEIEIEVPESDSHKDLSKEAVARALTKEFEDPRVMRSMRSAGPGPETAMTVDLSTFKADDPFYKRGIEAEPEM